MVSRVVPRSLLRAAANESSDTVTIVGSVAGALILLALATTVYLCSKKRCRRSKATLVDSTSDDGSHYELSADVDVSENLEWGLLQRLDAADVQSTRQLATGVYYNVWEGTYDGATVFVKALVPKRQTLTHLQCFLDTLNVASACVHPCILGVLGAAWSPPLLARSRSTLVGVLEHMDLGSMRTVLMASNMYNLAWHDKLSCILDMASALAYLHSRSVIHGAFNTKNIILDSSKRAKLANVGLSRAEILSGIAPGVWWVAPEMLTAGQSSPAIDVYAFGRVLVELDTHRRPSRHLTLTNETIQHIVTEESTSPRFTSMCPDWIQDLALLCIARKPETRPSAATILAVVRSQLEMM
ncbi:TKL protein kinase [Saprolegnia diclina VS20]|uniref:TKL protein kinase n=1 Tax=Saprolegnia diclina (strain VS20) TaxID=1156394 RepID=T0RDR8_SAPDV|nr:TKL protein kinase [Saprolegnia diclina VS20]EQC30413.1 TKL protein kinase [Saprolegnia diclina VS20]|eukprot:XP_008616266.1 TKL protein kinase [Saprolegnia diclina VS20]